RERDGDTEDRPHRTQHLEEEGPAGHGLDPPGQRFGHSGPVTFGHYIVTATTGDHVVAGHQVPRPQDQPDAQPKKGKGPTDARCDVLRTVDVNDRQRDRRQNSDCPAGSDPQLGPPGTPWVVLIPPVGLVLAHRDVVRPWLIRIDPEMSGVTGEREPLSEKL